MVTFTTPKSAQVKVRPPPPPPDEQVPLKVYTPSSVESITNPPPRPSSYASPNPLDDTVVFSQKTLDASAASTDTPTQ